MKRFASLLFSCALVFNAQAGPGSSSAQVEEGSAVFLDLTHAPFAYNLMLEDALAFDQHYQNRCESHRTFELYVNPFYQYLANSHAVGGFVKGQVNIGDFYISATTAANAFIAGDSSTGGVSGVTLKTGYDFFLGSADQHHIGLYLFSGFPTGGMIGGRHFNVGGGFNAHATIFKNNDTALRFLVDTRYRYSMPHEIAHSESSLRTQAHTIDFWTAFHTQHRVFNFEFGNVLTPSWVIEQHEGTNFIIATKPYVACSFTGTIADTLPAIIGLGVGYNFIGSQDLRANGATAWLNMGISF